MKLVVAPFDAPGCLGRVFSRRSDPATELVFTTLTKQAMPVIRYRTRDLTRLLPGTARRMRRIERIRGRSDDMLIIRGVNVPPSLIEALLAQEKLLAPHYVIELRRPIGSTSSMWWSRRGPTPPAGCRPWSWPSSSGRPSV